MECVSLPRILCPEMYHFYLFSYAQNSGPQENALLYLPSLSPSQMRSLAGEWLVNLGVELFSYE